MEKNLITSLLRVYHSDKTRHANNRVLARFVEEYNIGERVGASFTFSESDKEDIRQLLLASEGIDTAITSPEQWFGLTRAESLAYGGNEKLTDSSVRSDRVAIKTLPGKPLMLNGQSITLPNGVNLDLDWHWLVSNHKTVLLVENWEAFNGIHQVTFNLSRAGENPLVVFRGSPVYRQDYVISLLRKLAVPVYAFVDFDPAGLVIAQSLPFFSGLIAPPFEVLELALAKAKNQNRYLSQLPEAKGALDRTPNQEIAQHWRQIQAHGKALPQEYFLMENFSQN